MRKSGEGHTTDTTEGGRSRGRRPWTVDDILEWTEQSSQFKDCFKWWKIEAHGGRLSSVRHAAEVRNGE